VPLRGVSRKDFAFEPADDSWTRPPLIPIGGGWAKAGWGKSGLLEEDSGGPQARVKTGTKRARLGYRPTEYRTPTRPSGTLPQIGRFWGGRRLGSWWSPDPEGSGHRKCVPLRGISRKDFTFEPADDSWTRPPPIPIGGGWPKAGWGKAGLLEEKSGPIQIKRCDAFAALWRSRREPEGSSSRVLGRAGRYPPGCSRRRLRCHH